MESVASSSGVFPDLHSLNEGGLLVSKIGSEAGEAGVWPVMFTPYSI